MTSWTYIYLLVNIRVDVCSGWQEDDALARSQPSRCYCEIEAIGFVTQLREGNHKQTKNKLTK